jgi:acyl carrier protein
MGEVAQRLSSGGPRCERFPMPSPLGAINYRYWESGLDQNAVAKAVREFVIESFLLEEDEAILSDDDSFLESGLIDSTGILELIAFLEETWPIEVADEEMIPENLDGINRVARYVCSKSPD